LGTECFLRLSDTTLRDKVCQCLAVGRWFSPILQFPIFIFFLILTLDFMTKTLNQIIFFPPP
jgi:hypothetical protein